MSHDQRVDAGDGTALGYRVDGAPDAPALLLLNSIATTMRMWDGQRAEFAREFRVISHDTRGHGTSGAPPGDYSLDRLARDVLELLDHLAVERASVVGLSLGGFVAQELAVRAPERVDRLVLVNTSPHLGPAESFDAQIADLRGTPDMIATARGFIDNWFPPDLRERDEVVGPFREDLLALDPVGLAGCLAAVRDADLRRVDALIDRPTLVIAGEHDPVTRPEHGRAIADAIPGAQFVELPVVHMSNVEAPRAFMGAAGAFLRAG